MYLNSFSAAYVQDTLEISLYFVLMRSRKVHENFHVQVLIRKVQGNFHVPYNVVSTRFISMYHIMWYPQGLFPCTI